MTIQDLRIASADQLWNIVLCLENNAAFCHEFEDMRTAAGQRMTIKKFVRGLRSQIDPDGEFLNSSISPLHGHDYEHLRRYLSEIDVGRDELQGLPVLEFWRSDVRDRDRLGEKRITFAGRSGGKSIMPEVFVQVRQALEEIETKLAQAETPKENPMSNPIKIETLTLVNGQDIAKLSDSAVYSLIASEEAAIEELKKIKNQPQRLKAELVKREEGIKALVAHLDSKKD